MARDESALAGAGRPLGWAAGALGNRDRKLTLERLETVVYTHLQARG